MAESSAAGSGVFYLRSGCDAGDARRVDLSACTSAAALLPEIGRQLAFPAWYGGNFDALHDCLSDPACVPGERLLISGLDALASSAPEEFSVLMEVLASAAEIRAAAGSPLLVLVDTTAANLPPFAAE